MKQLIGRLSQVASATVAFGFAFVLLCLYVIHNTAYTSLTDSVFSQNSFPTREPREEKVTYKVKDKEAEMYYFWCNL